MKVILVESDLIGRLETLVNGAIEKFTPERVVDIKYSSAIDGRYHEYLGRLRSAQIRAVLYWREYRARMRDEVR